MPLRIEQGAALARPLCRDPAAQGACIGTLQLHTYLGRLNPTVRSKRYMPTLLPFTSPKAPLPLAGACREKPRKFMRRRGLYSTLASTN